MDRIESLSGRWNRISNMSRARWLRDGRNSNSFIILMYVMIGSHLNFFRNYKTDRLLAILYGCTNWLLNELPPREGWEVDQPPGIGLKYETNCESVCWDAGYQVHSRDSALRYLLHELRFFAFHECFLRFLPKCSVAPVWGSISSCRQGPCSGIRLIDAQGILEACN